MLDKYSLYMIDMYGRDFVDELQAERGKPVKMTRHDWYALELEYIELCNNIPT